MSVEKSYRKPSKCEGSNTQDEYGKSRLSRSRSLGVFTLILALFIFQVAVFVIDKFLPKDSYHDSFASNYGEESFVGPSVQSMADPTSNSGRKSAEVRELFEFDPNTITLDSLCMLGLSPRQAQTILNYRAKGGHFERPEDFSRMYVVSDEFYERVRPYICVKSLEKGTKRGESVPVGMKTDEIGTNVGEFVTESVISEGLGTKRGESVPKGMKTGEMGTNGGRFVTESVISEGLGTKRGGSMPKGMKTDEMGTNGGRFVPERMNPKSVKLIVELNGADSAELVKLYGIGPYYAGKIIAYRERLGGFHSVEQLMEVRGIDSARFEGLAKNVVVDPLKIRNFRLDTAGKAFLIAHPYIGAYTARGIILLRDKLGKSACSLENLIKERVIAPHVAEKLWPYVR